MKKYLLIAVTLLPLTQSGHAAPVAQPVPSPAPANPVIIIPDFSDLVLKSKKAAVVGNISALLSMLSIQEEAPISQVEPRLLDVSAKAIAVMDLMVAKKPALRNAALIWKGRLSALRASVAAEQSTGAITLSWALQNSIKTSLTDLMTFIKTA